MAISVEVAPLWHLEKPPVWPPLPVKLYPPWIGVMKEPSAIKNDLFAPHQRAEQIDHLGDPLAQIEVSIDFALLAAEVDRVVNVHGH